MSAIPDGRNLFVVDIHYTASLAEIEPHIDAHMAFIEAGVAQGRFLAAGAKVPRTGGVIIAVGASRPEIEAFMAEDPFSRAGLVSLGITEFRPGTLAPALS